MARKDQLTALISKGYFPKELPPTFSTESFGASVDKILHDWERAGVFSRSPSKKKKRKNSYSYKVVPADPEIISIPKRGYERRNLHITHPVPQALLGRELVEGWRAVQKWLLRQTFSEDEVQISPKHNRAIKGINFQVHLAKKGFIEGTSDWLVKTDISRFYPSIYTHSIPWAAYGKERVKKDLALYGGSLADRLDLLVRACNRNQTIGIPIGPETSRIIAEVISSRIDTEFQKANNGIGPDRVDRLQDDWFIGAKSLEEAESLLASISAIYRLYGLEINGSKTDIAHILSTKEAAWVSEINSFLSHRSGPLRGVRLRELLKLALRLQSNAPSEPVVGYALSTIEAHHITTADIEAVESFLLKAAVVSPISMNQICRIIISLYRQNGKISRQRVRDRFVELAERNLENGNMYEAIWLIYTIRGLRSKFDSKRISELSELTSSSALALVLLDMESKSLVVRALPKNAWEAKISRERVQSDWVWLLAYEACRRGWLSDQNIVMGDPLLNVLNKHGVEFYDPSKNVTSSKAYVRRRTKMRRANIQLMNKLLFEWRKVHYGSY